MSDGQWGRNYLVLFSTFYLVLLPMSYLVLFLTSYLVLFPESCRNYLVPSMEPCQIILFWKPCWIFSYLCHHYSPHANPLQVPSGVQLVVSALLVLH